MSLPDLEEISVAVIGLGYVGLPLAVSLSTRFPVVGFDLDTDRVAELSVGVDRTGEVPAAGLEGCGVRWTSRADDMRGVNVFIIAVPTPVDAENQPDLSAVLAACRTVGGVLSEGAVVIVESTGHPGVTEQVCGPELAQASGLACGDGFFLGYSPERVNPGDHEHTVDKITKVVAGQTPEVAQFLAELYGAITNGNVFVARDIRTAEAAKIIENAQRDINIAFINEMAMIFEKMGVSTHDVLAAAATKWNFLDFQPGLVGGHCIGIDPYYLAHAARLAGHDPAIVLAGRQINDGMAGFAAERISSRLPESARVLVLGLTFKENVSDLRNSKVAELIASLSALGHAVEVHDSRADRAEALEMYGIELTGDLADCREFDAVVGAVAHDEYRNLGVDEVMALIKPAGLCADLKGIWRHHALPPEVGYWQL